MKWAPLPASRPSAASSGLARPFRARRPASPHPPLSQGIKTCTARCFPTSPFIILPHLPTMLSLLLVLQGSAHPSCCLAGFWRLSPIAMLWPCIRHLWSLATPLTLALSWPAHFRLRQKPATVVPSYSPPRTSSPALQLQLSSKMIPFSTMLKRLVARLCRSDPSCLDLPLPATVTPPLSWSATLSRYWLRAFSLRWEPWAEANTEWESACRMTNEESNTSDLSTVEEQHKSHNLPRRAQKLSTTRNPLLRWFQY